MSWPNNKAEHVPPARPPCKAFLKSTAAAVELKTDLGSHTQACVKLGTSKKWVVSLQNKEKDTLKTNKHTNKQTNKQTNKHTDTVFTPTHICIYIYTYNLRNTHVFLFTFRAARHREKVDRNREHKRTPFIPSNLVLGLLIFGSLGSRQRSISHGTKAVPLFGDNKKARHEVPSSERAPGFQTPGSDLFATPFGAAFHPPLQASLVCFPRGCLHCDLMQSTVLFSPWSNSQTWVVVQFAMSNSQHDWKQPGR